ncbi:MAG: hypothetical protein ACRBN8_34405 [Nannocystales bacterium]
MNHTKLAALCALASLGPFVGCTGSEPNPEATDADTDTAGPGSAGSTGASSGATGSGEPTGAGPDTASSGDESGSTGAEAPQGWVLDFTLFVEGGVQVSGIGASASVGRVALVTDFERVILVDPATGEAAGEFSVQLGELPRQGSTEALSWTDEGLVAVLYPDDAIIRQYDVEGTQHSEIEVATRLRPLHGAMTVDPASGTAYLIGGTAPPHLLAVDLDSGTVTETMEISGPIEDAVEGLSLSINGDTSPLWALTAAGEAFRIDVTTGEAESPGGTFAEVDDPSGIEAFVSPDGDSVLAVSDDDNQYNDEPGPLRLYLLD